MNKVLLELKYGGITVCRLNDPQLLKQFKKKIIKEAEWRIKESEILDPIIATMDQYELAKLKNVLDILIPSSQKENQKVINE